MLELKSLKIAAEEIEAEVVLEDHMVAVNASHMVAVAAESADHMVAENASHMVAAVANADLMVAKAEVETVVVAKVAVIHQSVGHLVLEAQLLIHQAVLQEENAKTKIQEAVDGNLFA